MWAIYKPLQHCVCVAGQTIRPGCFVFLGAHILHILSALCQEARATFQTASFQRYNHLTCLCVIRARRRKLSAPRISAVALLARRDLHRQPPHASVFLRLSCQLRQVSSSPSSHESQSSHAPQVFFVRRDLRIWQTGHTHNIIASSSRY